MQFEIISVKDNSVRVDTGIVSFDVIVLCAGNGSLQVRLPRGVYIPNAEHFRNLAGAVKAAYQKSLLGEINNDNTAEIERAN